MQRKLTYLRRSEDEEIKDAGLTIDLDECARKGVMSKEEKNIAKWYGIYASRQAGNNMARIVIPGGVLTSTQARNISKVSEHYGMGVLSITTRQALQLHYLKVGGLADMIRDLGREGSTTRHGCGDVTRNVASCPLAETCKYRRFNVREMAIDTMNYLGACSDLDNLPRKFKIAYSGCPADCAQPHINCVGATAVLYENQGGETIEGFKVVIGGGMGWKPFVAEELFSFVPKEKMLSVSRAIALLFRDHGDRFNRAKSRLKFVVYRQGIEKCREIVLENLKNENIDVSGILVNPINEQGVDYPERPLTEETPIGTDGKATVEILIPKGEIGYRNFKRLAVLADMYGDQRVYTTNRQNMQLKGIGQDKIDEVKAEIHALGYKTDGVFGLKDIVPCVGTSYCPKAVTKTRDLYDILMPVVSQDKYKTIEKQAFINITGCPNSCSPYRIADIGFRGMRIREEYGSTEAYEVLIGGSQTDFGKKLGEFKVDDVREIVENVLDHFIKVRKEHESLTSCVNRVGVENFKEVIYEQVSI